VGSISWLPPLSRLFLAFSFFFVPSSFLRAQDPPRILLDQPLRAVEYQLRRLTNEELTKVERRDTDVRYRPVYFALLTRRGLPRPFYDEALAALTKLDKTTASPVLLEALAKIGTGETATADRLLLVLLAQPSDTLRKERGLFVQAVQPSSPSLVQRGAFGALLVGDGDPDQAWQVAEAQDSLLLELLRSVRHLPGAGNASPLGDRLFTRIAAIAGESRDATLRVEALLALPWTRPDAATFAILAREIMTGASEASRVAAARALLLVPEDAWPKGDVEGLAKSVVAWIGATTPDRRVEPAMLDVVQLGEKLSAALPLESRRALRRELRALGVQVIRIEALPEKLLFDVKLFVVEGGKPVQIVLVNPDAMPHNLVVGQPGSLKDVATLAGSMTQSADPDVKSFVPNTPLVLHATKLVQGGDTERLGFTAPATPGEYVYVCTFPGHWLRMYGVMLVVPDLEAWEAKPTVPIDPMTQLPFTSRRN
jgi:DNA-binding transcriptional ArsR family regulator